MIYSVRWRSCSGRAATITHMRRAFKEHGFDVADCRDDQVSGAILCAATLVETCSSTELFAYAFALRFCRGNHDPRGAIAASAVRMAARAMAGRV